jgi:hypothetical protein
MILHFIIFSIEFSLVIVIIPMSDAINPENTLSAVTSTSLITIIIIW